MNLLRVELLRLRSRRVTKLLGLAMLGILVLILVSNSLSGDSDSMSPHDVSLLLAGTSLIPISAMWLLGASFVGGDWHSGFMVTTLTWESRRLRLLLVKAAVVVVAAALATVVFLVLTGLAIFEDAGPPGRWLGGSLDTLARAGWLAVVASMIGFGIAAAARSTAAALGAGIAYLLGVEVAVSGLWPGLADWMLVRNATTFIAGEETLLLPGRSPFEAAIVVTAYAVVALLAGFVLFTRRDVT